MTALELKSLYTRYLKGHEGKLHFAAHSHHFWPDVSREAQLQYWDDCAQLSDEKWGKIFGEVIPKAQKHVAQILKLRNSSQIAFAPNTHEFTTRLLSLFLGKNSLNILTTSSEFHSWRRQLLRISEFSGVQIHAVNTEEILKNRPHFLSELKSKLQEAPDLFFISQVFFDSGIALTESELFDLSQACSEKTVMVIDGYHGFGALPLDLSRLEGRVFYLGGGYKYAQAGEGVALMVIPKGKWRPAYTGWFAEYADLSMPPGGMVGYSEDYMAFMGATQDPSGLYRFNAVWDKFASIGLDIPKMHEHVKNLQQAFMKELPCDFTRKWSLTPLFNSDLTSHGHFLTFTAPSENEAQKLQEELKKINILIDRRGARLRFGFGLYQDFRDVSALCQCLKKLA